MQAQTPEVSAEKATTPAADMRLVSVEQLQKIHRDLDACQKVIWLARWRSRGYDCAPSYVTDALARLKEIEAVIQTPAPATAAQKIDLNAAMQTAFELGGLDDGSYLLEADELKQVFRAAQVAQRPALAEQPVAFRILRRNHDGIWATDGRAWVDGVPDADMLRDIAEHWDQWRLEYAYAAPIAQTAPQPEQSGLVEAMEHVSEGAEMLQNLIDNIEAKGNYSAESTVLFLNQALGCIRAALSTQGGAA